MLGFDKFFEARGEKNISMTAWEDPKSPEEGQVPSWDLKGLTVKKVRVCELVVQVKGNPMVKEAPTKKTYYLIE